MNQKQACFDQNVYRRFLDEKSGDKEEAKILDHLDSCKVCQAALENLAGKEQIWNEIQSHLVRQDEKSIGEETQDIELRDRQRDLKKIQNMLAPTDNPEMMGRLGGYEICGVIGRGSTGIVVKALDTRLNRFVAIKLLAPAYSNHGCSRRRFEREGRAIASVKDPHVVPIHTVDEFQGTPYIVMQYIPDGSLDQRLRKVGPLSTKEVACIGMQVAKGLAAAHHRGIIHRDVKPANVLLENGIDGAMVTDFGLARVVDEATMTHSGSISGTPQYMSPEQAKGEKVDPRSDLFSLGSTMYAASTGHGPFKSESVFGVIKKVCDSDPQPIREINPDIAPWLAALIARLHAKEPHLRFDSADDVAALLSQELAHMQSPTMVPKPKRTWWDRSKDKNPTSPIWKVAFGATIGASLLLAGAVVWNTFGFNGSPPAPPTAIVTSLSGTTDPMGMLAILKQENESLSKFENTIETTIDVEDGGTLFLRSNLGSVNVNTHDKPVVEMKLVHIVSAAEESIAKKAFRAIKLDYSVGSDAALAANLSKDRDAAIVVKFPIQKLTQKEIEESEDLAELKEQLQIRNNSHFTNAKFELLIPENFNIDVQTSAGSINVPDIDGRATLVSHGGRIHTGNVSGRTVITSHGGHIESVNIGDDAQIVSHGGHIEVGNVEGKLTAESHGGHITAQDVESDINIETHGGNVKINHAHSMVTAKSHGGGITIWKAEGPVNANTPAGSIRVNFLNQPDGDSILRAGAGSVRVGYIDDLAFDIDANTQTGRVTGPFVDKKTKTIRFKLNDGEHKLVTSTEAGSIKFRVITENEIEQIENEISNEQIESQGQAAFQKAYDMHMEGEIDAAILAHQHAATFASHKGIATYNLGCAWSLKGEKDKAFEALENAISFGFHDLGQFERDEDLDSLREDVRFEELMSRLHELRHSDDSEHSHDGASFSIEGTTELIKLIVVGEDKFQNAEHEKAEELFRSALQLEPKSGKAAFWLGMVLHSQNKLDEAYKWHEKAANSGPFCELGYYNMACVHSLKNETDDAIKFLGIAVENGFDDAQHMAHDEDLENVRDDERFDAIMERAQEQAAEYEEDEECDEEDVCEEKECESCEDEEDEIGKVTGEGGESDEWESPEKPEAPEAPPLPEAPATPEEEGGVVEGTMT